MARLRAPGGRGPLVQGGDGSPLQSRAIGGLGTLGLGHNCSLLYNAIRMLSSVKYSTDGAPVPDEAAILAADALLKGVGLPDEEYITVAQAARQAGLRPASQTAAATGRIPGIKPGTTGWSSPAR